MLKLEKDIPISKLVLQKRGGYWKVAHYKVTHVRDLVFKFAKRSVRPVSGNRIMNLTSLQDNILEITKHTALCKEAQMLAIIDKPAVTLVAELQTVGLASILLARCQGC